MIDQKKLHQASAMWKAGGLARDIAAFLGIKVEALGMMCTRNRGMFPRRAKHRAGRKGNRLRIPLPEGQIIKTRAASGQGMKASPREISADRMRWITKDGAIVTLPRISMIECPRGIDA